MARCERNWLRALFSEKMGETLSVLLGQDVQVEEAGDVSLGEAREALSDPYVTALISTEAGTLRLLFPTELVAKVAGRMTGEEGKGFSEGQLDALKEALGQVAGTLEAELGEASFEVEVELSPLSELEGPLSGLVLRIGEEGMVFLSDDGGREEQVTVRPAKFPSLESQEEIRQPRNLEALMDLELVISVELGRVRMRIREILQLGQGAIVELNKLAGEPVDLLVNGKKFAEGEVVVIDENFGVRITSLMSPRERLGALS